MSAPASPGHAVVTGASSGIGAAIAAHLLGLGWQVTGLSRTAPAEAPLGYQHRAVDLSEPGAVGPALAGLRPTALVHAAGLMRGGMLGALELRHTETLWRLHVDVAFQLANLLAPVLPDGGRMVLLGSRAAAAPGPELRAPLSGVLHLRPAPDAEPFVRVGQTVQAGDPVCIIEAMKVFNQVRAERAGCVVAILAEGGTEVDAGQTLLRIA